MKFLMFVVSVLLVCSFFTGSLLAHNKVVVVPLSGGEKATGDATQEDVLQFKTFSNSGGTGLTGTRPSAPVGKTGQTVSQRTGDDGYHEFGVLPPSYYYGRFTAQTSVVVDNLTGLMWQRSPNNDNKSWNAAIDFCHGLELYVGTTVGYNATDWRLPNVKELQSLIDFSYVNPALSNALGTGQWTANDPFTLVLSSIYWSSTTNESKKTQAWTVNFNSGAVVAYEKAILGGLFVWCVRGGLRDI